MRRNSELSPFRRVRDRPDQIVFKADDCTGQNDTARGAIGKGRVGEAKSPTPFLPLSRLEATRPFANRVARNSSDVESTTAE
jgi:hypothetical protein